MLDWLRDLFGREFDEEVEQGEEPGAEKNGGFTVEAPRIPSDRNRREQAANRLKEIRKRQIAERVADAQARVRRLQDLEETYGIEEIQITIRKQHPASSDSEERR